jgi:hypothetical protein
MQPIPQPIAEILELARWAPSGDNTQPWRFEVIDDHHLVVHGFDTRDHCVYDLDGHPSQIAHGALLETLAIAASAHGLRADISRRPGSPDTHPDYLVELIPDGTVTPDPLLPHIRAALGAAPPDAHHAAYCSAETGAAGSCRPGLHRVAGSRGSAALAPGQTDVRQRQAQAHPARSLYGTSRHHRVERALQRGQGARSGAGAGRTMTLKLMRWVMANWQRVEFFNTWLAGHLTPRIEMDLLPGLFCGAHFAILADKPPERWTITSPRGGRCSASG